MLKRDNLMYNFNKEENEIYEKSKYSEIVQLNDFIPNSVKKSLIKKIEG